MRIVGYARTDWVEQTEGTFPSVAAQEEHLRQFAAAAGVDLVRVTSDTGLSPKHGTCAGLVTLLDDMDADWDAVVVQSLCRLTEVPTVSFQPLSEFKNGEKKVFVANAETAAALKKLAPRQPVKQAPKKAALVKTERTKRREIAERLLKGREAGARAGKHQSGPAPFGYRRDYSLRNTEGVMLVPDPEEADVVRLIFREYLRLRSMKRLIKLLDEQGLRTRRGKRWSRAGVSWILKNDTYVGRVHFGKIRVKGRHESVVPPILFNKVQKLIRQNNKRSREGSSGASANSARAAG